MAIKTREELMAQLSARIGADTSDDAIALIEDFADTMSDLEQKANGGGKDWKSEYEKNDKAWREKYIARFSGTDDEDDDDLNPPDEENKNYSFDNLFE